jgi:hypothetical protein
MLHLTRMLRAETRPLGIGLSLASFLRVLWHFTHSLKEIS